MVRSKVLVVCLSGILNLALCVALVLSLGSGVSAEGVRLTSASPRYARVVVSQDGSRVLRVVFDESKGTGRGYDVIYCDVESGGRAGSPQKVVGKAQSQGTLFSCEFPAINVNVPLDEKGQGVRAPCLIRFSYRRFAYEVPRRTAAGSMIQRRASPVRIVDVRFTHSFNVAATVAMRQGRDLWEYSYRSAIRPSETLAGAPVWKFNNPPKLAIATRPDMNKKGCLGIALDLAGGGSAIEIKKGGASPNALVEVKRPDGRVIHRQEVPLDKLVFG